MAATERDKSRFHGDFLPPVILLVAIRIGLCLSTVLPRGTYWNPKYLLRADPAFQNTFGSLISWDGLWYRTVALYGYRWAPDGVLRGHFTNLVFFPLWPVIQRIVFDLAGSSSPGISATLGILFWIAGGAAFVHLVQKVTGRTGPVYLAALFYAVQPGGIFSVMGYPSGLLMLTGAMALVYFIDGKPWQAAVWLGIGTAVGPAIVFESAALCLIVLQDQFVRTRARQQSALQSAGLLLSFGIVSVSGLLCFMGFLWRRFGDPFLFISAQAAWGGSLPMTTRLIHLINPFWYALGLAEPVVDAFAGHHRFVATVGGVQAALQTIAFLIVAWLLWAYRKPAAAGLSSALAHRSLWLTAVISFAGFDWMEVSTAQNTTAALRVMFWAPAVLCLAFLWVRDHPRWLRASLFVFMLVLIFESAILAAGYLVI
jgi:hypothetical protein